MKTIKIELSHPKVEGMEVKSVTADIEKGYSVVEYGVKEEKFVPKRGDIIINDYCNPCIVIFDRWKYNRNEEMLAIAGTDECQRISYDSVFGCSYNWRLATPSEQQLLFDALAKEGKKWNSETLEIEDIENDILVPESIGIYRLSDRATTSHDNGDGLYVSFNGNKQVFFYSDGVFGVMPLDKTCLTSIPCKLIPCKREDLKAGDTFYMLDMLEDEDVIPGLPFFNKVISPSHHVYVINEDKDTWSVLCSDDTKGHKIYKVVPK